MWEPHLSLLVLGRDVEVLSARQEWSWWVTDTAVNGFALSERSQEGLRAETAPSKAWGTNRAGAVPVPQLLLEPLAAVTRRASASFQRLPTLPGSRAGEKIAIAAIPWCPWPRAVPRLREDPLRA